MSGAGQTASYTYDPLGNRNSQTVNGTTTQFLIDPIGLGDVVSTYNGSGSGSADPLHLWLRVWSARPAPAEPPRIMTSASPATRSASPAPPGSYVNKYSYLPFGQTTAITATLANPFTFVGRFGVMQDSSTLFNMRAREFSTATGQFSSKDPLNLLGGDVNIRRYAGNDPTIIVDPSGLAPGDELLGKLVKVKSDLGFRQYLKAINSGYMRILQQSIKAAEFAESQGSGLVAEGEQYIRGMLQFGPDIHNLPDSVAQELRQWYAAKDAAAAARATAAGAGRLSGAGRIALGALPVAMIAWTLDKVGWYDDVRVETSPGGDLYKFGQWIQGQFNQLIGSGKTNNGNLGTASATIYENVPYTGLVTSVTLSQSLPSVNSATTTFTDSADSRYSLSSSQVVTTWKAEAGNPNVIDIYASVTFQEFGQYGITVIVNGSYVAADPGHNSVIVYEMPIQASPVNFTLPIGGSYDGPVATFLDLGGNNGISDYSATLLPTWSRNRYEHYVERRQ